MKKIYEGFVKGCFYAVLIAAAFCLFALLTSEEYNALPVSQFFLIVLCGMILSAGEWILRIPKTGLLPKALMHYAALLFSFLLLFVITGKITGAGAIFVAVVLFTLLYAIAFALTYLLLRKFRKQPQNTSYRKRF